MQKPLMQKFLMKSPWPCASAASADRRRADEAVIEASGLRMSYDGFEAVRGVDLQVQRGEIFTFLGPNGAGKTTTVEILEGYRRRSAGEVVVLGEDPQERSRGLRQRIGIVLQSGGIYGHLTPREALRHWASFYPKPRGVEEALRPGRRVPHRHDREER